jgi:hypothetical protein
MWRELWGAGLVPQTILWQLLAVPVRGPTILQLTVLRLDIPWIQADPSLSKHVLYRRSSISGTTVSGKMFLSGTSFHAI